MRLIPGRGRSNGISSNVKEERQDDNSIEYSVGSLVTYWGLITSMVANDTYLYIQKPFRNPLVYYPESSCGSRSYLTVPDGTRR